MWCDNCLLLFPLRGGAIAWGVIIALYNITGAVFLFNWGIYLYFIYQEPQIYGGIAIGIAAVAIVNIVALSNRSYIWSRVCKFVWPFIVVISAIRGIIMIVQLYRGRDKIVWECENGGQLWGSDPESGPRIANMPDGVCRPGWSALFTVFIVAILVDLVFQLYMLFLNWRFSKRLEHYRQMNGPVVGGYYKA
ncbi:hypothetical protein FRC03_012363 [Tulasnella sp. 419]|nr:hypothetical protein FRC03_012363 [Tulasnella sp. 419]